MPREKSNNNFLYRVLGDDLRIKIDKNWDPILSIEYPGGNYRIFCPPSDDYIVTVEVVDKAIDFDATVIAYTESWQKLSPAAESYAAEMEIIMIEYKRLIGLIKNGKPLD